MHAVQGPAQLPEMASQEAEIRAVTVRETGAKDRLWVGTGFVIPYCAETVGQRKRSTTYCGHIARYCHGSTIVLS